ncbi:hypothetical protein M0M60_21410 (plasmid) [Yersinia pestis EV76-CN]|uniref:hypothetical protein n=1 Tax=Yersinia pestis TaxID=632 RepID=UPI0021641300|nr:hypothetical protein [Yersinia pestis]UVO24232.1 hypothetical protein M0M60_21410 [Yersinia pestis EV76-CN]
MNGKTEFMPDERDLAIKAKHSNKDTPESRPDMFNAIFRLRQIQQNATPFTGLMVNTCVSRIEYISGSATALSVGSFRLSGNLLKTLPKGL